MIFVAEILIQRFLAYLQDSFLVFKFLLKDQYINWWRNFEQKIPWYRRSDSKHVFFQKKHQMILEHDLIHKTVHRKMVCQSHLITQPRNCFI